MRHYPDIPLEKVRDGKSTWWRVLEPVMCEDRDGCVYTIPVGFVSNFASVPRPLYLFFAPHGTSAIPSVKHDFRYIHLVGIGRLGYTRARTEADRQYRLDLLAEGMSRPGAWLMWAGVRLGGGWWWKRHFRNRLAELFNSTILGKNELNA